MAEARDHQQDLHPLGLVMKRHFHAEFLRDRHQSSHQVVTLCSLFGNEAHAHEETASAEIIKLRTIDDVAAFFSEKA
ncbi:hypothetical protein D3C71_2167200 [compost metagenome]